jgi:hypothetical protein
MFIRGFLLSILLLSFPIVLSAQDDPRPLNQNHCEYNSTFTYGIYPELLRKGDLIFVIARLGDGEESEKINRVRLEQYRYVMQGQGGIVPSVYAKGERIKGEGGIEIYHGGKLIYFLRARRGCYFDFKCCDCTGRTPILKNGKINRLKIGCV